MLNRINSFLIILVLLYITFEYCQLYEGQTGTFADRSGNTDGDDDASVKSPECTQGPTNDFDGIKAPCQFKGKSCTDIAAKYSNSWNQYRNNTPWMSPGSTKDACTKCVQGSDMDGSFRYYLSNVGTTLLQKEQNKFNNSQFAADLCDGMAAGCDDAYFYALNKQVWWNTDCSGVNLTDSGYTNVTLCSVFGNTFISFFTGFLGGTVCNLKIRALQLESAIENKFDDVKNSVMNTFTDAKNKIEAPIDYIKSHLPG